jgi:outer membrane lipopolysaccharide assembly protein LptE/RlpB
MRKILLVPLLLMLTACAYTPQEARSINTASLCRAYVSSESDNFLSPVIRDELTARGETACISPQYVNAVIALEAQRRANLFNAGAILLQQGRPYTIPSNTCVQRYVGQNLVTQCY